MSECRDIVDTPVRMSEETVRRVYPAQYLKTQHNRKALVSKLSEEVLLHIFTLATFTLARSGIFLDYYYDLVSIRDLRMITQVCRDWRYVAIEAPLLWTRYLASHRPKWTTLSLQRALRAPLAPLEIQVYLRNGISDMSKALLAHISHVSVLRLEGAANYLMTAQNIMEDESSDLVELQILCTGRPAESFTLLPSKFRHADRLRHLELESVDINFDSDLLQNLTTLSLRYLPTQSLPTWTQLMTMLCRMPFLKHLTLENIFPDVDSSGSSGDPIGLAELDSISISSRTGSQIQRFIEGVVILLPRQIRIQWDQNDAHYLDTLHLIATATHANYRGPCLDKLEVDGYEDSSHLHLTATTRCRGPSIDILVPKHGVINEGDIVPSFVDLFCLRKITELDFRVDDDYYEVSDLLPLAKRMPCLRRASVGFLPALRFFEILGQERATHFMPRVYFRKLRLFTFFICDFSASEEWMEVAMRVLDTRRAQGVPLDFIDFDYPENLSDEMVARFEEAVTEIRVCRDE